MKALGLLIVLAVLAMGTVEGLAQLRTKRPLAAAPVPPAAPAAAPAPADADQSGLTVSDDSESEDASLAEVSATSEADETTEDGSNDESAADDMSRSAAPSEGMSEEMPIHEHFRQFTKPMEYLPVEMVESNSHSHSHARADDDGEGKGSNPTYILPVDPFNYFPFFNGFSNVNPFSQFYPPAPYLYPQYTNYMHRYANHAMPPQYGNGAMSYGGHWDGHGAGGHGGFGHGHGGMYAGHGGGWGGGGYPHPHMSYPFGAYKLDVSGPDVRSGANNPEPFPQFSELSSTLITPEIIPKDKSESDLAADEEEDAAEMERVAQPVQLEVDTAELAEQQHANDLLNEAQAQADADDEGEVEADEAGEEAIDEENVVQASAVVSDGERSAQSIEDTILAHEEATEDTNEVEFEDQDEGPEYSSEHVEYKTD